MVGYPLAMNQKTLPSEQRFSSNEPVSCEGISADIEKRGLADVLSFYPNPTSDLVYFKHPLERKINIIVISDVAGRTIRTINVIGLKDTTIDLGKLAEGIYHLNFFADDWIATKKVVRY
jgi:hypothetical protein